MRIHLKYIQAQKPMVRLGFYKHKTYFWSDSIWSIWKLFYYTYVDQMQLPKFEANFLLWSTHIFTWSTNCNSVTKFWPCQIREMAQRPVENESKFLAFCSDLANIFSAEKLFARSFSNAVVAAAADVDVNAKDVVVAGVGVVLVCYNCIDGVGFLHFVYYVGMSQVQLCCSSIVAPLSQEIEENCTQ